MADLVFVLVVVAFFAAAVLLVRGCERLVDRNGGSGEVGRSSGEPPAPRAETREIADSDDAVVAGAGRGPAAVRS